MSMPSTRISTCTVTQGTKENRGAPYTTLLSNSNIARTIAVEMMYQLQYTGTTCHEFMKSGGWKKKYK